MVAWLVLLLQFSALPAGEPGESRAVVQVPDTSWRVSFDPQGFEFGVPEYSADGTRVWVAGDGEHGLIAHLSIRPAESATTAAECRARSDSRNGRSAKRHYRLEHDRRGPLWLTSYVVPEYRGVPVNQRNVFAFLYREGYCIELELSMPHFKPRHRDTFDNALDALQVVDKP